MARKARNVKSQLLAMGKSTRGQRDDRDLPNFLSPRTGPHTKLPRRKGGNLRGGRS